MIKLIEACNKLIRENEVHIHNYHKGYSGPLSPGDSSGDTGSVSQSNQSDSNNPQQNSSTNALSSSHPTGQGISQQNTNQQVSKFMSTSPKKAVDMKDFKEVFIKNHVRRYRRKPSIGLMKQTFGVTT